MAGMLSFVWMEAASIGPTRLMSDGCAGEAEAVIFGVGERGERGGPSDVTVAGAIGVVAAFGENPFVADESFSQREEVGGNVRLVLGEMFFGDGELVHEGEAEVLLFAAEVDFGKFVRELLGGFPTDLPAQPGFVACGANAREFFEEEEEDGFDEVPVFSATSEQGAKPEVVGAGFVNIDDGEVALAGSCDVKAEAELGGAEWWSGGVMEWRGIRGRGRKEFQEVFAEVIFDLGLAALLGGGIEVAEEFGDVVRFEVDALDFVIGATALD